MPNPTRQQIINAHEALEELKNVALSAADFCGDTEKYLAWKSEIIAALPPKPALTMNEIEWDDDKHYLAEAEHLQFGKVIMLGLNVYDQIDFIAPSRYASRYKDAPLEDLTPTGKRYTLTEVQE
nr:MAG TPA: hypothetical protein [Caudoviricetes sp.]